MKPILFLMDYPTISDLNRSTPFSSGIFHDLRQWLTVAGFTLADIEFQYVHNTFPPNNDIDNWFCTKTQYPSKGFKPCCGKYIDPKVFASIEKASEEVKHREMIIVAGDLALMATHKQTSVFNWRGSKIITGSCRIFPIISPMKAAQNFEWTFFIRHDLQNAYKFWYERQVPPLENFQINPTFAEAVTWLNKLLIQPRSPIGVDIETRFRYITYISVATSPTTAICIPFVKADSTTSYWTKEEEVAIVTLLLRVMSRHECVGQNFTYDLQYLARYWGANPSQWKDTMIAWHVLFAGFPRNLAFICSMTLPYYTYWKDEGAGHIPNPSEVPAYQRYNCKDATNTLWAWGIMMESATDLQQELIAEQMDTAYAMYPMMLRGVRQDLKQRSAQLSKAMNLRMHVEAELMKYTDAMTGGQKLTKGKTKSHWFQSPKQLMKILYGIFGLPVQKSRTTRQVSTDDDCLKALGDLDPLFRPVFQLILEYRSLGVFISTFLDVRLDWDNRMRCSYGVGMAETYRCTSSADAFDFGGNLQNIPSGNEE